MKIIVKLVLVFCIVFALFEFAVRVVDPAGVSYYPEVARHLDTLVLKEPSGYKNPASYSGTHYGTHIETNSLGLRDREYSAKTPENTVRIFMLGDSVVFGVGVEAAATLPKQIEKLLNEQKPKNTTSFEVVNLGVTSYNTVQELQQYREVSTALEHDVVLLMFIENDIQPEMWIFDKRSNVFVKYLQKSHAVAALLVLKRQLMQLINPPDIKLHYDDSQYQKESSGWNNISESLQALRALTAKDAKPLVVLTRSDYGKPWALLSELSQTYKFDLEAIEPYADERWSEVDPKTLISKKGGSHLNSEGLGQYAHLIVEYLLANDLSIYFDKTKSK